jgi:CheY-like chemotaxis protein
VDDDEGIRETMQFALEMRGYRAVTAVNGKDGLERLPHIPRPCLILLDLMMPVMDGRDFVRALERDPALKDIPVVVVTAFGELSESIDVRSVIAKPVPLKVLYETVQQYCCGDASKG